MRLKSRRLLVVLGVAAGVAAGVASSSAHAGPAEPPEVRAGKAVYERCQGCHALARDRTGPRHCGLIGRPAAAVPGFNYSEALRRSGLVWTQETLDRFLAAPLQVVPGTTMGYAGVANAADREALIAYLAWASDYDPACRNGGR